MQAKNISTLVLGVQSIGAGQTNWIVTPATPGSIADQLAAQMVTPAVFNPGWYRLPSGATMFATSTLPVGLFFFLDASDTVRANTARAAGAWIESKFPTSPVARLMNQAKSCASSAGQLASGQQLQSDAIRSVLGLNNCRSLVSSVLELDGRGQAAETTAFGEFLTWAKRLAGGSFNDELAGAAAVIIER